MVHLETCRDESACIRNLNEFYKLPPLPQLQDYPCNGCVIGTARMTKNFVPEDDKFGNSCLLCGSDITGRSPIGYCRPCTRRKSA
jgi:hypothetical protein